MEIFASWWWSRLPGASSTGLHNCENYDRSELIPPERHLRGRSSPEETISVRGGTRQTASEFFLSFSMTSMSVDFQGV